MEYKKTAEYAFDLLEHFYNLNKSKIELIGKDKFKIMIPLEIYRLLQRTDGTYPKRFRGMDLEPSTSSLVSFVLK